jgi:hypothetical protein
MTDTLEQVSGDDQGDLFSIVFADGPRNDFERLYVMGSSPPVRESEVREHFLEKGLPDAEIDEMLSSARERFAQRNPN